MQWTWAWKKFHHDKIIMWEKIEREEGAGEWLYMKDVNQTCEFQLALVSSMLSKWKHAMNNEQDVDMEWTRHLVWIKVRHRTEVNENQPLWHRFDTIRSFHLNRALSIEFQRHASDHVDNSFLFFVICFFILDFYRLWHPIQYSVAYCLFSICDISFSTNFSSSHRFHIIVIGFINEAPHGKAHTRIHNNMIIITILYKSYFTCVWLSSFSARRPGSGIRSSNILYDDVMCRGCSAVLCIAGLAGCVCVRYWTL